MSLKRNDDGFRSTGGLQDRLRRQRERRAARREEETGASTGAKRQRRTPAERKSGAPGRGSRRSFRASDEDRRWSDSNASPVPRRARSKRPGPAPSEHAIEFHQNDIDPGAKKVVQRLTRAGYEAYLVGGCVRDLLVGKSPKDFDVATSARPEEVRALFRNSRIIGRRFRLVHVLFPQRHVIETATFRRNPPKASSADDDDLLIRSDNFFGEAHEDALRRDFTINALFYDVDRARVLDWVGGMAHIQSTTIDTIGEPAVRFQEDPIRMLRAIKFAARLDFGIEPRVYDAAVQCRGCLAMAARPRLSEEILRLMRGGASQRSMWLLWEMGMMDILLPELSAYLADQEDDADFWQLLAALDQRIARDGEAPNDILLGAVLLAEPLAESSEGKRDRARAIGRSLEPMIERLALPRRQADGVRRILTMAPKVRSGRGKRFQKSEFYGLTQQLFDLQNRAKERLSGSRRRADDSLDAEEAAASKG
ncbi:MAG: polynucleotide adenylyltransferase PcnB [Polyangiaceae bacterium]|nr:polynucleotide adenylyltransferase PcnB [Polyangiaceae bacterium]